MNNRSIANPAGKARMGLILSMVIFGTIGIFRRYLPLPSGLIAMFRGFTGMLFLLVYALISGNKPSLRAIRMNLWKLALSGAFIGFNWIMLFEAYNFTSVAVATLCYYMAPMIVMAVSPFLLGERLSVRKVVCILAALAGMSLVSGVFSAGGSDMGDFRGVLLGLGAAVLYASVIIMNKKIHGISAYDRTIVQLGTAGIVLVPYVIIRGEIAPGMFMEASPGMIMVAGMLLVVGIIHTGLAYALYFGSMDRIKAQTVALLSYIDPIVAIILSAVILREGMGIYEGVGAVLVLGATIISELPERKIGRR